MLELRVGIFQAFFDAVEPVKYGVLLSHRPSGDQRRDVSLHLPDFSCVIRDLRRLIDNVGFGYGYRGIDFLVPTYFSNALKFGAWILCNMLLMSLISFSILEVILRTSSGVSTSCCSSDR